MSPLAMVSRTSGVPMARSSRPVPARSSPGVSAPRLMRASSRMLWSRRCMIAVPKRAWRWSTIPTGARNTCPFGALSAWRKPGSNPRWAALAETINGPFKAVEYATLEWVDWFNNRRLLAPIGNFPPAEANSYAALETEPMAAQLTKSSPRQTRSGTERYQVDTAPSVRAEPATVHESTPNRGKPAKVRRPVRRNSGSTPTSAPDATASITYSARSSSSSAWPCLPARPIRASKQWSPRCRFHLLTMNPDRP